MGYIKVEGHADLARDTESGAIVNRNKNAYEIAIKRAEQAQKRQDEIKTVTKEINTLKTDMHEIKTMLMELTGKNQNGNNS
tara:strand:- start:762 stop:1004 length:243 start_codon:yes stop_codon:yes gene_type:complete